MIAASSAGSSPVFETAPDARAVTAISAELRSSMFGTTVESWCTVDATGACAPDSICPTTPVEVQAADGPRVVVVCVSEADLLAYRSLHRRGRPSPYPRGCNVTSPTDYRANCFAAYPGSPAWIRSRRRWIRASDQHLSHDSHPALRAVRRTRRRSDDAQAVLETALILPILLFLVCNFIGVMVQVTVQEQLNSATALAAQSRFQAPENSVDPAGGDAALRRVRQFAGHRRPANRLSICGGNVLRNHDHIHGPAPLADGDALHVRW